VVPQKRCGHCKLPAAGHEVVNGSAALRPKTEVEPADDPMFLNHIDTAISGSIEKRRPTDLYLIRVDNWFDHKWLNYSGRGRVRRKEFSAEVCLDHFWRDQLTFPPFTPKRIVSETYFCLTSKDYYQEQASSFRVHPRRLARSAKNLHRRVGTFSKSAVYIWFSCCSAATGRASIMLYESIDGSMATWYASLENRGRWMLGQVKGAPRESVAELMGIQVGKDASTANPGGAI
jgi:hypothetical protein